jgi:hypothetical protein
MVMDQLRKQPHGDQGFIVNVYKIYDKPETEKVFSAEMLRWQWHLCRMQLESLGWKLTLHEQGNTR